MSSKDDTEKNLTLGDFGRGLAGPNSDSIISPSSVRSQIDSAIAVGSYDPLGAIASAVETGSNIAPALSFSQLTANPESTVGFNLHDTISALGNLGRPYDQFASIPGFEPYIGSMTSLASAAGIASTLKGLAGFDSATTFSQIKGVDPTQLLSGIGKSSALLSISEIAGMSSSKLVFNSPILSELTPAMITGVLAGATLASTRAVLGVESAYALFPRDSTPLTLATSQVPDYLTTLHEGLSSLTLAAKASWDVFTTKPELLSGMSLFSARSPAIEIYSASQAAAAISLPLSKFPPIDAGIEEIFDATADEFESRLSTLEPALVEMYRGAVAALEHGGPDWRRQTMVSFRELTTHVMHILTPEKEVKSWAKPEHFDKGNLTRRARLEYIFESVANGELTEFFRADLKASIELFDLLNSGTHRLGSKATPQQLRYLRGRVVNFISSMLEARGH